MPYHAMPCHVISYHIILAISNHTKQYDKIQYNIIYNSELRTHKLFIRPYTHLQNKVHV